MVARAAEASASVQAEFQQGENAYNLGHFEESRLAFERAYQLDPLPAILFNIGQCYRQLGAYDRAAFFYQRYLEARSHRFPPPGAGSRSF